MSTILKALRRLEEEKTRGGSGRPLREEIASGPSEQPRGRRLPWLPLAAMVIGAGLGASAWYVWPYYERAAEPLGADVAAAPAATPTPAAPAAPPVVAALPAAPPVVAPPSEPAQLAPQDQPPQAIADQIAALQQEDAAPPEDAFASQVEVIDRPAPAPRIEPVPAKPAPAAATPPVAQAPRLVAEPGPQQHGLPEPAGVMARRAAPEPPAPAKPAATKPAPPPPDASDWEEPSEPEPAPARVASARETAPAPVREPEPEPDPKRAAAPVAHAAAPAPAPEVHVRRTQWHPDKTRRSADVEVRGKQESVREGDVVGEYVVTEIRPSGVVLTRDGERIETKIGK